MSKIFEGPSNDLRHFSRLESLQQSMQNEIRRRKRKKEGGLQHILFRSCRNLVKVALGHHLMKGRKKKQHQQQCQRAPASKVHQIQTIRLNCGIDWVVFIRLGYLISILFKLELLYCAATLQNDGH